MWRTFTYCLLLLCVPQFTFAQGFVNDIVEPMVLHQYDANPSTLGGGVSFVDFNQDGLDDISFCQNDGATQFFVNMGDYFEEVIFDDLINDLEQKMLTWVDFDNDGDLDIFMTFSQNPCKLYRHDGDLEFTDISESAGIPEEFELTYGHSWGDFNNDGLLDLYICNYDPNVEEVTNHLMKNNGDYTFSEFTESAGVPGGTFSFQSLWFDYDRDGWQDLFVINDRNQDSDINVLYHNNGDGTFEDVSVESGLNYQIFSMSNTAGDYDNDGDVDIFISNYPYGHLLHENNGNGTFNEVAEEAGVITYDMGWAGQWIDYDLNGYQDLHICTSPFWIDEGQIGQDKFYVNNGDGTFEYNVDIGFEDDETWNHSSAVGDWNEDGHFDLVTSCFAPGFSSLFTSVPGENNYLKVGLEGVISNKDGVGSWIDLYSEGGHQVRYTYCGEGYLTQNSKKEIFGVGQDVVIDSLVITWLSGIEDRYYSLDVNQTLNFEEGQSVQVGLYTDEGLQVCGGDSAFVYSDEFDTYLWSNGDTTSYTYVEGNSEISLEATLNGITYYSDVLIFEMLLPFELELFTSNVSCAGHADGSINIDQISGPGVSTFIVNGQEYGFVIDSLSAGEYEILAIDTNQCIQTFDAFISEPDSLTVQVTESDVTCYGFDDGYVEIAVTGGTPEYEIDWGDLVNGQIPPGDHQVLVMDANGCQEETSFIISEPDQLILELSIDDDVVQSTIEGGTPPYEYEWSTGSTDAQTELDGSPFITLTVTDFNGCIIEGEIMVQPTIVSYKDQDSGRLYDLGNGLFNWCLTGFSSASIEVYDSSGKLVMISSKPDPCQIIDLSSLDRGVYILKGISGSETLVRSVVK